MIDRILFIEPPKNYWFLMGEYLPPPLSLLALAAYVEQEFPDVELAVFDAQAERADWDALERRITEYAPSLVVASGFATCNTYAVARAIELAKQCNPACITVVGGQHFSFLPGESLDAFPEIDVIVRGEGEQTLVELIRAYAAQRDLGTVAGISFRREGRVHHTDDRALIADLDALPYPAYHLVEDVLDAYHFSVMAGHQKYLIVEGSRGCAHRCTFCTQWRHWCGVWRTKSAQRIADEMAFLHERYGGEFFWFTDDNFEYKKRGEALWTAMKNHDFIDDVSWFVQARVDDVAGNPGQVTKLASVGNRWVLMGIENNAAATLKTFNKGIDTGDAQKAVTVLKDNGIFTQGMFVIGARHDTHESIEALRGFARDLNPELAIFSALTPFPGSGEYYTAKKNGWLEDMNYAHYDMVHAIMPTETLTRDEVQQELYACYRSFYAPFSRKLAGILSPNALKRRAYIHMAGQNILKTLKELL